MNPDLGGFGLSTQVITSILSRPVAALLEPPVVDPPQLKLAGSRESTLPYRI
jgi:hypothetical protein